MRLSPAPVLLATCLALTTACRPGPPDADGHAPAIADTVVTTPAAGERAACTMPELAPQPGTRLVSVCFACDGGVPGQLHPVHRRVADDADPVRATIEEMLRGPTEEERERGLYSLFSEATASMLRGVERSRDGDTLLIDFADFRAALRESPTPTSFLPGGVMADITWTVFQSFPEVEALRLLSTAVKRCSGRGSKGAPRHHGWSREATGRGSETGGA